MGRTQQHYVLSMIHNAAAFSDELLMEWLEYLGWFVIYIDRVYEYIEITGAIRIYSSTPPQKITQSSLQVGRTQQHYVLSMIHNAAAFSDELLMEWLEYLGWFVIYIDRVYEYIEITGAIRIYSSTPPQKITQSSLQVGRRSSIMYYRWYIMLLRSPMNYWWSD